MSTPEEQNGQIDATFGAASELLASAREAGLPVGQPELPEAQRVQEVERHELNPVQVTQEAAQQLLRITSERPPYSLEDAQAEKPLMHYSRAGNILQILRYGVQSNNFKVRLNEIRGENPRFNAMAQEMTGFREKQGGSYQGQDSISVSKFSDSMFIPPGNMLLLIDPAVPVYGDTPDERDASTGYGHGIKTQIVNGGFEVGNPTAFQDEVLAANIIPPEEIRAIVIDQYTSITSAMGRSALEHAKLFMQEKQRDTTAAVENLLANIKLLADLAHSTDLQAEIDELGTHAADLPYADLAQQVAQLQRRALKQFVGADPVAEDTLRQRISETFGIKFIAKPPFRASEGTK